MKFILALIISTIAITAQAVEFHKFNNYSECKKVSEELFTENLKRPHLSTQGMPSHWLKTQHAGNHQYTDIVPALGTSVIAPDGTNLGGYGGQVRNGKIVKVLCLVPNSLNGSNPSQWMAIQTFDEDLARYKEYQSKQKLEKDSTQSFLKSKDL